MADRWHHRLEVFDNGRRTDIIITSDARAAYQAYRWHVRNGETIVWMYDLVGIEDPLAGR